jgi:hypothetical protein
MRIGLKIALAVSGVIIAAAGFALSPYFHITEVDIQGYETISREEIHARSGIEANTNLLFYNTKEGARSILKNPYADSAVFEKKRPGAISITIRERRVCGYVEYLRGHYLYIDENGRVLEVNTYLRESLPVVTGLKFDHFSLGEILQVEDSSAFKTVVQYAWLFNRHNMADMVSRIDVSDGTNTKIQIHNLEFNVGDDRGTDEKIRTIAEILDKLPNAETIRGFVDMKEIRERYVLTILT